jgi:hypothetical protein
MLMVLPFGFGVWIAASQVRRWPLLIPLRGRG